MQRCPACSSENADDKKFCGECGCNLVDGLTGFLSPSSILENRYRIVRTIGRGGMGAVYLAQDQRLNNMPVAIKEMSTRAVGQGSLQAAVSAFKKEAAILIGLRHPALPRVIDFFSQGFDRWYLVMDYIDGQDLSAILEAHSRFAEARVLDWASQICKILHFLHTQNPPIIFRDLKPSNIMLTPQGCIKLVDFGIARHFRPDAGSDTVAYGSSGFAPPEQYGDRQTSVCSDIYALGATLHNLLTGINPKQNPFLFDSPNQLVEISPRLNAAIMAALEHKPENRPTSVGQFWEMATGQSWSERMYPLYYGETASPSETPYGQDRTATLLITQSPDAVDHPEQPHDTQGCRSEAKTYIPPSTADQEDPAPLPRLTSKAKKKFGVVCFMVVIGLLVVFAFAIRGKNPSSPVPVGSTTSPAASVDQASSQVATPIQPAVASSEVQSGSNANPAVPVATTSETSWATGSNAGTKPKSSNLSNENTTSVSANPSSQAAPQAETYDARPAGESYDFRSSSN